MEKDVLEAFLSPLLKTAAVLTRCLFFKESKHFF